MIPNWYYSLNEISFGWSDYPARRCVNSLFNFWEEQWQVPSILMGAILARIWPRGNQSLGWIERSRKEANNRPRSKLHDLLSEQEELFPLATMLTRIRMTHESLP